MAKRMRKEMTADLEPEDQLLLERAKKIRFAAAHLDELETKLAHSEESARAFAATIDVYRTKAAEAKARLMDLMRADGGAEKS